MLSFRLFPESEPAPGIAAWMRKRIMRGAIQHLRMNPHEERDFPGLCLTSQPDINALHYRGALIEVTPAMAEATSPTLVPPPQEVDPVYPVTGLPPTLEDLTAPAPVPSVQLEVDPVVAGKWDSAPLQEAVEAFLPIAPVVQFRDEVPPEVPTPTEPVEDLPPPPPPPPPPPVLPTDQPAPAPPPAPAPMPPGEFVCDICGEEFSKQRLLNKHVAACSTKTS